MKMKMKISEVSAYITFFITKVYWNTVGIIYGLINKQTIWSVLQIDTA